jgi:hypothetical protein
MSARLPFRGLVLVALLMAGCSRSAPPDTSAEARGENWLDVAGVPMQVTGPFTHQNVAVFLVHSERQDPREFITLDEGLKAGTVKVTEKAEEQVNQLVIDNQSDYPLFLQEGDRLSGGKQDRTIHASMVVPAHSGKTNVAAFCIEPSRWRQGQNGAMFGAVSNTALAPKSVRLKSKFAANQAEVWEEVANEKRTGEALKLAASQDSSLNSTYEAPKVKELCDDLARALASPVDAHPTAVGVAIAINGKIEEVNIYPNHQVLQKLYPRLLQSYALQAVAEKSQEQPAATLACPDVVRFMAPKKEENKREVEVDKFNALQLIELDDKSVEARTRYDGVEVHVQRATAKNPRPRVDRAAPNPRPVETKDR